MKKQTLTIALAVTALFAASAFAGDFDPILDADIIDNQMVGLEATGRVLTADELAFDPVLDADIYEPALAGTGNDMVVFAELDFDYSGENEAYCTARAGTNP